ncbi:MAG: YkgJ family cysteine cluster protein [Candidatus Verstraetearchaeota archaeon]|nr:YkgJ family cysteine cluster protein [Candidatus Verstraetearchaeota archaeon]
MASKMRKPVPDLEMEIVDSLPGFSCRRCARCCTGKVIALYDRDMERIRSHVKERYCERTSTVERALTGARYKMRMVDGGCVFLEKGLCRHYDLRPNTCRRHPFIVSEGHKLVASTCPGVEWSSEQGEGEYRSLSKGIAEKIDLFLDNHAR